MVVKLWFDNCIKLLCTIHTLKFANELTTKHKRLFKKKKLINCLCVFRNSALITKYFKQKLYCNELRYIIFDK